MWQTWYEHRMVNAVLKKSRKTDCQVLAWPPPLHAHTQSIGIPVVCDGKVVLFGPIFPPPPPGGWLGPPALASALVNKCARAMWVWPRQRECLAYVTTLLHNGQSKAWGPHYTTPACKYQSMHSLQVYLCQFTYWGLILVGVATSSVPLCLTGILPQHPDQFLHL